MDYGLIQLSTIYFVFIPSTTDIQMNKFKYRFCINCVHCSVKELMIICTNVKINVLT